jgi:hypothetical protein
MIEIAAAYALQGLAIVVAPKGIGYVISTHFAHKMGDNELQSLSDDRHSHKVLGKLGWFIGLEAVDHEIEWRAKEREDAINLMKKYLVEQLQDKQLYPL